jgi:hypothetical protein
MSRFMRRYPSPSLIVSIIALVVSLGGAGYSATGGNFILGRANSASSQTKLVTPLNGAALRVDNTSAAASATGMNIFTNAARPPLAVNSSVKVENFNADKLDGLNSTQFANKLVISYNLAPGADSAPITPPANRPVFIMGVTTTPFDAGVGHVTLYRNTDNNLTWTGSESYFNGGPTSGVSGTAGVHIVYIDYFHKVDIQVNNSDTIRIHNSHSVPLAGNVTLIW